MQLTARDSGAILDIGSDRCERKEASMSRKVMVGGVAVALVIAIVGVVLFLGRVDRYVAGEIEEYGGAATGTQVSVGGVDIAVTKGRGEIDRLTIANPQGFGTDYAVRLDNIRLAVALGSLTGKVPVVNEAVVDGAHFNIEQRGEATNLTTIQRNMKQTEPPATTRSEEEGRIRIDRFRLKNASVTLTSDLLDKPETFELKDIVVQDIGRDGGATYGEATEAVLTPILAAARSAAQDRLRQVATDSARQQVEKKARDKLKDLLDRG
jgi:hypothetical protein